MNKGFTLVELLVVIGIIALLIAFLMPSLNRARQQASRIQCMSNMRQHGIAFAMYIQDFKGLPPMNGGAQPGYHMPMHLLYCYTGGKLIPGPADWLGILPTNGGWKVWICPEFYSQDKVNADHGGGYGMMTMNSLDFDATGLGPGIGVKDFAHPNGGSMGWWGWTGPGSGGFYNWAQLFTSTQIWTVPSGGLAGATYLIGQNKMTKIRRQSEAVMEAELFPCFGGYAGWDGRTFDELGGNPRHGGSSLKGGKWGGVLYADGHVRGSTKMGPFIPWNYHCFTRADDAPGWPGGEPYQPAP